MKRYRLLIPAVLIAAIPSSLAAQGGPPGPPPDPLMQALDRDHDRVISKYEIKRAPRVLKRLDDNSDGKLSGEEIQPEPPDDGGQGGPPPRGQNGNAGGPPGSEVLDALDADGDGAISAEEILNATEALADLDTDGDGELSSEEIGMPSNENGGPPRGGGQAGGEGPPQGGGPMGGQGPPPRPRGR